MTRLLGKGSKDERSLNIIPYVLEKKFITDHIHFASIVLLREVLWTALVGIHDREGSLFPKRDNLPNSYEDQTCKEKFQFQDINS